jgi:hypothetical protein
MKKLIILLLGVLVFLTIACENHSTNSTALSKYPTQIGNQWEYQTKYTIEYYDTLGNIDTVEVLEFGNTIVKIESVNDTVNGISNLVLFSAYEVATPDSAEKSWYSNSDSGLYVIAYSGAGRSQPVIPKINARRNLLIESLSNSRIILPDLPTFMNLNFSDSIQYFDPPRKVLAYPLKTGVRWVELIYPFYRERYVDELKSVQVPAGIYNCYEIKSDWDFEIELTDYISLSEGLIRRVVYADSMSITTEGNPDTFLYARITSNSQLVNKSF